MFDGQKRRVPACGAMSSRPRSRDVGGLTPLQPALRYRTPSGAARTGKKSKGRLKKLEQGWDGRRSTGLPDYNALSDKYCVFTRGDAFRKHFTEMVGSNSLELLEQSRPTMPTKAESLLPRAAANLAQLPTFELPLTNLEVGGGATARRDDGPESAFPEDDMPPLYAAWPSPHGSRETD